jgi:hypothetical protein
MELGTQQDESQIGLCLTCMHGRPIKHPRGGDSYWRCGLSDTDKRFPKYPRLPVLQCIGYEPKP